MKAERRHELKTNTLATQLEKAPAFFKKYGSHILLGVILCLLAYILIRNYTTGQAEKATHARENLADAIYALSELRTGTGTSPRDSLKRIEESVAAAMESSSDSSFKATAMILRGDANWEAANYPVSAIPGATTRPELGLGKPADQFLKAAEDAYSAVLQPPLNAEHSAVNSAHLGLAAIAENRMQFAEAKKQYQQVIDDPATDKPYADLARKRIAQLPALEAPILASKTIEFPEAETKTDVKPGSVKRVPLGPPTPAMPATGGHGAAATPTQPATSTAPPAPATGEPSTRPAGATTSPH